MNLPFSGEPRTTLEKNVWGIPLGRYKIFIRYAGQTFYTELEGEVSDATTLFTNKDLQEEFADIISEEIADLSQQPKQTIQDQKPQENQEPPSSTALAVPVIQDVEKTQMIEAFRNFEFSSACRVLILQEKYSSIKHLILQVGRIHTLPEYATYNNSSHWSLIFGAKSLGKADGLGLTLPTEYKLPELGRVMIHLFCPDDPRGNRDSKLQETLKDAKTLAEIVPWIPQALNIREHLKAKNRVIKELQESNASMHNDIGEMSVRLNAAKIATARTTPDGEQLPYQPRGPSVITVACYGLPILVFGIISYAFTPLAVFVGVFIGLLTGAVADSKRR